LVNQSEKKYFTRHDQLSTLLSMVPIKLKS